MCLRRNQLARATGRKTSRSIWRSGVVSALSLLLIITMAPPPTVHADAIEVFGLNPADLVNPAIPTEALPPNLGQAESRYVVAETGYTVGGLMLDYWRTTGAERIYGAPISEPFNLRGRYAQAFERGVLTYRTEFLHTDQPTVRLHPIGRDTLQARLGAARGDGRRSGGGGDRRSELWYHPSRDDGWQAGHEFSDWYADQQGEFYLGRPLSAPMREREVSAQYFSGGLLMTDGAAVRLAPLPVERAAEIGIPDTRTATDGLPVFDERALWSAPHPDGFLGDRLALEGRKRIDINVAEQRLWAYQGDELVLTTLVSTGKSPNETEIGRFHVRVKRPLEDMAGFTDATGEVVALGDDEDATGERYEVEDVPHVLYFNLEAEALHGAYWHDNFGTPMSHGCVNLPLDAAAFIYHWATLGTEITVRER